MYKKKGFSTFKINFLYCFRVIFNLFLGIEKKPGESSFFYKDNRLNGHQIIYISFRRDH